MGDGFYEYLYNHQSKKSGESTEPTVAQDEAIGKPWTHRYTIYCASPSSDFIETLKKNGCVVAVYEKVKESADSASDKEDSPSNS